MTEAHRTGKAGCLDPFGVLVGRPAEPHPWVRSLYLGSRSTLMVSDAHPGVQSRARLALRQLRVVAECQGLDLKLSLDEHVPLFADVLKRGRAEPSHGTLREARDNPRVSA